MDYSNLESLFESISNSEESLTYSFDQIENILGSELPASAKKYRQWWENNSDYGHVWAKSWLDKGWKVSKVKLGEYVIFCRMDY